MGTPEAKTSNVHPIWKYLIKSNELPAGILANLGMTINPKIELNIVNAIDIRESAPISATLFTLPNRETKNTVN
jgi:hypothetical protein